MGISDDFVIFFPSRRVHLYATFFYSAAMSINGSAWLETICNLIHLWAILFKLLISVASAEKCNFFKKKVIKVKN